MTSDPFVTIDILYDDKAQKDIIDPNEWNLNFKEIEDKFNINVYELRDKFGKLISSDGASEVGATSVQAGGAETVQGILEELYNLMVKNVGNESVDGVKTFTSSPVIPTPTTDYEAATKKYVDLVAASISQGAVADGSITNNKLGSDIKIGSLAGLSTTAKTSVVSAINELVGSVNSIIDNMPVVPAIVNSLTETVTGKTLDATQGKILDDKVSLKADKATTSILRTEDFAITQDDEAILQKCYSATTITILVPSDTTEDIALETEIPFARLGAGAVTFDKEVGVTVRSVDGKLSIDKQYQTVYLKKIAPNEWLLFGALA